MKEALLKQITTKPKLKWIDKHQICLDETYQRSQMTNHKNKFVKEVRAEFCWGKFGALTVSEAEDNVYRCIDGGGRLTSVLGMSEITKVPCVVVAANSIQQEANAFIGMNQKRILMGTYDKYRAGLVAQDPAWITVSEYVKLSGRIPSKAASPTSISCFSAIYKHANSPQCCERFPYLWTCIIDMCQGEVIDNMIVHALAFIDSYATKQLSDAQLKRIASFGKQVVLRAMINKQAEIGINSIRAKARGLIDLHNKRLTKNRIKLRD